jgi:hypothetical protein
MAKYLSITLTLITPITFPTLQRLPINPLNTLMTERQLSLAKLVNSKINPSIRNLFNQGSIFLRIRQLEETTASLASQLKGKKKSF